ncbi:MAG: hypothetical protein KF909_02770 [Rhodocyclaceae bacterium]|nr:hypothetical protein [Rhodocyclaceae bacterium]
MTIMIELELIPMDGKVAVVLPQVVVDALQARTGDKLYLAEMLDGSYRLARHDGRQVERMELVEGEMHEDDA